MVKVTVAVDVQFLVLLLVVMDVQIAVVLAVMVIVKKDAAIIVEQVV